ncbi:two-component hybrid sensor and regulator [Geminocystis sp. NIES-3708]|uniref:GAF domain-containing sensor histidine kinase n=1 Tax=Geminocystis sp. NIES-3708 TaxID=1615909 RepID=UPI0005FC7A00|nr:ATP-binding protein [Geminocystis sp. NIES-3708]BAQ62807.1 two-component hybrid sensor and regulator [Geminocystis sp. NIES-3708]
MNILLSNYYIPHGHCYLWQPSLIWVHLFSDLFIFLAYFSIPLMLIYFVHEKKDIPFNKIFILFSAFILFCGLTHLIAIITLWYPIYWLSGFIKILTAIISVLTAFELLTIIPLALVLPTPEKLAILNQNLEIKIKEKKETELQLKKLNQELEVRVKQRTSEIEIINNRLNYKIKLEKLVTYISNLFIKVDYGDINEKFNLSLKAIYDTLSIDHCFLFITDNSHQITKTQFFYGNNINMIDLKCDLCVIVKIMNKLEFLKINDLINEDEYCLSKESYINNNQIKSILAVPLIYENNCHGFLMLTSFQNIKQWQQVDLIFVKLIAEIFIKAIETYDMQKDLKTWNIELQRSNQELEQFAYVASHDLQEPLRIITSFSELFIEEYGHKINEEGKQYLQFIISASHRMKQLIKDLLALSRIQTKGKEFILLNCNQIIEEVLDIFQISMEEKKAKIIYQKLPHIMGDKFQITQLWQNLISNALKFHSNKPIIINITVESLQNEWLFCVEDNGIGIPVKFQEKIFIVFQRLYSSDQYEGTGIGLALCQKIVTRHGGKIWVQSEIEKGSKFFFTIPKYTEIH